MSWFLKFLFGSSNSNSRPPSPQEQPMENSTPRPTEVPTFDQEWRHVNWDEKDKIEADLREFKVRHPEITHLRILLLGAVGAGKSSFINSVNSVFEHRVMTRAEAATGSTLSHTKRYKSLKFRNRSNGVLPFIFNDIMGLQDQGTPGIHPDDIINAMLGHVTENHAFNPISPLRDGIPGYIRCPTLNDKVHCLVTIMSAQTSCIMYEAVIESMKSAREKACELGIPQVLILTHIDEGCPLVKQNLRNVYISKKIKKQMQECSNTLGIPMTCIFPVKNYHEESDTNNDVDVLVLLALRQILNFTNDYVEDLTN